MKQTHLASTNQKIELLHWTGQGRQPWRDGYSRILKPLGFKSKKGNLAEILIVRNSSLVTNQ